MKTILVPTDFSDTAHVAFRYALSLARALHGKLILFHDYQVPVPVAEVPFNILNEEQKTLKADAEKKLKTAIAHTGEALNIPHEYLTSEGEAVDAILAAAKNKHADLIIMGATGETGLSGVIFGSTSLNVIGKAHCPVIAIPSEFPNGKQIRRIAFATDYHQSDIGAINTATEIANASNAHISILHISSAMIGADEEKTLMSQFKEKVQKSTAYPNISFQVIHGYNIEERLEEYLMDENMDMLMMATHYRTFFDRLFRKSITRDVAKNISIPVVAFHYNSKTSLTLY